MESVGSGFEPRAAHQLTHCANRVFLLVIGLIEGAARLRHPEDRDHLIRPDDLDLSDQGIDQRLGLRRLVPVDDLVDVSDDLGQLGGRRHGRLAVEFFSQLVAALS
ncbi:MAG TPA: hypothetical protein VFX16_14655 [Pseudonocardiaceae bacterium]|nr:hypothetical protein [Pseudonocardiaceae bacterium]